ncbi:MAG: aspartate--tRNA ligase [Patescibacteria group bacterium]
MQRILNKETTKKTGDKVLVAGWVDSVRSHGKILFLDLRDRSGLLQVVVNPEEIKTAQELRGEWVVEIIGKVKDRPENMVNDEIITGTVELKAEEINVLSESKTPPFEITDDGKEVGEDIRMKYRYLDIRRKRMQKNLRMRHKTAHFFRNFLTDNGFIEAETPVLTKSTPEGARDFLVPSRKQAGHFYALPQSPQQYKQLLMVGGLEKYFQFARCFRDEDVRADRQAEFTQLDMEMSFVDREDVLGLVEEMFIKVVKEVFPGKKIKEKPFPRISYDEAMKKWGSDRPDLRDDKKDEDELAFAFVVDFPMFEKFDGGYRAEHHPFTKPDASPEKVKEDPENVLSFQYDLVLNGEEIGGGSIRSHDPEMLEAIFEVLGHKKEEIRFKFGHLLDAFEYGAPPHGGIAFGFERFLMIMLGEDNIREVMAFPKTGDGRGLMMGTPSDDVSEEQLDELHIKVLKDEKDEK